MIKRFKKIGFDTSPYDVQGDVFVGFEGYRLNNYNKR